ncbi:hypothetical protein [Limnoglobus roseus]|uniref:Uncharacterized protein n=1 Tax=Limnoglobus roseus TaxID=2598579 RepID=A0A5C1A9Y5_9BACT|nr:hypothetical protein [Limnoglobus roseus]QEL13848.1 hypothetical protein PX52LOC_00706 [Limnoglobus roseus]
MFLLIQRLFSFLPAIVAGLFIATVGGFLVKMAVDDAPKSGPSFGELAPGIAALTVGGILLLAVGFATRNSWKQFRTPKPTTEGPVRGDKNRS